MNLLLERYSFRQLIYIAIRRNNYRSQLATCCLLHASFLIGVLFDHEDKGDKFFRNGV
jgi:hypothetical protein